VLQFFTKKNRLKILMFPQIFNWKKCQLTKNFKDDENICIGFLCLSLVGFSQKNSVINSLGDFKEGESLLILIEVNLI